MDTRLKGIHHITLCPGGAQEDVDFFTKVLGQRLVKQTVLMDGSIPVYHFYYGNADADPGSILTCFPYSRRAGRRGTGQIGVTSFSVPVGSTPFWADHFDRYRVCHTGIQERFGARSIKVTHPAGLELEVVENPGDTRRPVDDAGDFGRRGDSRLLRRHHVDARRRRAGDVSRARARFRKVGVEGAYHRFEIPNGGPDRTIELLHEPNRPQGSWTFGAGTAHHIAFHVDTDDALVEQKALYEELGYTDTSEVKDRFYFHSMYVRSPGGVLVECTANVPGGFYVDEPPEELGTHLNLPPWYEDQRDVILSQLEAVVVPEANRPKPGTSRPKPAGPVAVPEQPIALSRTKAEFSKAH
jgi:glyoxalase family protein